MDRPSRLDPEGLVRLKEWGGDALVDKMIRLFIRLSPERMRQIEAGVEGGEADAVERGAHSLKSSAANLGASDLQKILERVEQHAERNEVDSVAGILPALRVVFDETLAELEVLMNGAKP